MKNLEHIDFQCAQILKELAKRAEPIGCIDLSKTLHEVSLVSALHALRIEGLIDCEKKKKGLVYFITEKGKAEASKIETSALEAAVITIKTYEAFVRAVCDELKILKALPLQDKELHKQVLDKLKKVMTPRKPDAPPNKRVKGATLPPKLKGKY